MNGKSIADIAIALVGVAMITALVQSRNTAQIVSASGNAFSGAVRATLGR